MEKDNIEALINKEYDYSNVVPDIGAIAYLIECCDKYDMAMAFTGMRLFHH
jgi:AICAR transformylase/IMP cyclohydrolase PurH